MPDMVVVVVQVVVYVQTQKVDLVSPIRAYSTPRLILSGRHSPVAGFHPFYLLQFAFKSAHTYLGPSTQKFVGCGLIHASATTYRGL